MTAPQKYPLKYYSTHPYLQVLNQLISLAKQRRPPIGYTYVFEALGLKRGNYAAAQAGHLLGEICQHMHQEGKPMLGALIMNMQKGLPGDGFFELAVSLGRLRAGATDKEKRSFWESELKAIYGTKW
jgi:hypothetical protein